MNNHQITCHNCQRGFPKKEIYQVGEKIFCFDCCKTIKNCSYCQKEIKKGEGRVNWNEGGAIQYNDSGPWITKNIGKYYLFCAENCRINHLKDQENIPENLAERQKRQELIDKGWKPCQGRGSIPFLTGLEKCQTLIPPTARNCERCQEEQRKEQARNNDNLTVKIRQKEKELQILKEKRANPREINKLEQEIKNLPAQTKNSSSPNYQNLSKNTNYWPWIIGISLVSLIIFGFWVVKKRRKVK